MNKILVIRILFVRNSYLKYLTVAVRREEFFQWEYELIDSGRGLVRCLVIDLVKNTSDPYHHHHHFRQTLFHEGFFLSKGG